MLQSVPQIPVGHVGNLTEQQNSVLNSLRNHLRNELQVTDPRYDDVYLTRFCRARDFDLTKTIEMFDKFISWRKANDVDNIMHVDFSWREQVAQYVPHGYYGISKNGSPIYLENYSNLKVKKILEIASHEQLAQDHIYHYEKLIHIVFPICSQIMGRPIEGTFAILDLKGVGMKPLTSSDVRKMISVAASLAQDNYPETMGKTYVINTPMMFKVVWTFAKGILDKKTVSKIIVKGSSYTKDLLEDIDADQLPIHLGGTCPDPIGTVRGPWAELWKRADREKRLFFPQEQPNFNPFSN